jgi:hypothetical protein
MWIPLRLLGCAGFRDGGDEVCGPPADNQLATLEIKLLSCLTNWVSWVVTKYFTCT